MKRKALRNIEEVPHCFFMVISQMSRSHGQKIINLEVFGLQLKFE